jgi:DNA anti-recombination protein RmuC
MKKAMSKIAQINKEELSAQKVELSFVDDLKGYEKELYSGIDDLMKFATDAREAISKGVRELDRLNKKVAERIASDVEKSAKELGVDVPELKQVLKAISAFEQQKKTLTKVLR